MAIDWNTLEHAAIATSAIGGITAVLLTPFGDRLFVWMLARNEDSVKAKLERWYAQRIARMDQAATNIDTLQNSVREHFMAQAEREEALVQRFADMFEQQNHTLSAIHAEAMATARQVSELSGKFDAWDGQERRRRER